MVRTQVFNLSCVFTESGESGFSTTYCGYPTLVSPTESDDDD